MDSQDSSVGSMASSSSQNSSQMLGIHSKGARKLKVVSSGIPKSILRKKGNNGSNKSQSSGRVSVSQGSEKNSISIIEDDNNSSIHTILSAGNGGSSSSMIKVEGKVPDDRSSNRPTSKNTTTHARMVEATSSSRGRNDLQLKQDRSNPIPSARPSQNPSRNPSRNPSVSSSRNPSRSPSRSKSSPSPSRHRGTGLGTGTGTGTEKEFTRMGARMGRRTPRHGLRHEDSSFSSSSSKDYDLVESCHIIA